MGQNGELGSKWLNIKNFAYERPKTGKDYLKWTMLPNIQLFEPHKLF